MLYNWTPYVYGFLLRFTSNVCPILGLLRHISLQSLSDLDFDLTRSLKVKWDGAVGLPICAYFLLVFNSTTWPNSAPLRDIRLQKLRDLDLFDISRPLKSNVIALLEFPYALLLSFNSNIIMAYLCSVTRYNTSKYE